LGSSGPPGSPGCIGDHLSGFLIEAILTTS
jgi:hypothetical protein